MLLQNFLFIQSLKEYHWIWMWTTLLWGSILVHTKFLTRLKYLRALIACTSTWISCWSYKPITVRPTRVWECAKKSQWPFHSYLCITHYKHKPAPFISSSFRTPSSIAEENKQTFTLTEKSCLYLLCPKFTWICGSEISWPDIIRKIEDWLQSETLICQKHIYICILI